MSWASCPYSKAGAELLFEMLSQRYERGSTLITFEPALPRMDRSPRLGAADRRSTRPTHPSCAHPGNERRQLPPQAEPPKTGAPLRTLISPRTRLGVEGPLSLRSRGPSTPQSLYTPTTFHWPTFTAPHWPGFAPPLTSGPSASSSASSAIPKCAIAAWQRITTGIWQLSRWSISTNTATGWRPPGRSVSRGRKRPPDTHDEAPKTALIPMTCTMRTHFLRKTHSTFHL